MLEGGRPGMTIWRMCIAWWITKAKHTPTVCNTYCFSTATMLMRMHLNVTHIYMYVCINVAYLVFLLKLFILLTISPSVALCCPWE
jgi:hypothetical protein